MPYQHFRAVGFNRFLRLDGRPSIKYCFISDAEKGKLEALLVSAILYLERIMLLREYRVLKDEKIKNHYVLLCLGTEQ